VEFIELDRAIGAVIGGAVGDALGAGYEFAARPEPDEVSMRPGTLTGEPAGYWTDDTAMAVAILETAASHGILTTSEALATVGEGFLDWYRSGPRDIGMQTSRVLKLASTGADLVDVAARELERNRHGAGNGSLMRTGPVALAHLGNDVDLTEAARMMSSLTHPNPYASDACVLWTIAIDRAIRTGEMVGPRAGLSFIGASRREEWKEWINEAETRDPREFTPNGYVVTALQAAWSAIYVTQDVDKPLEEGLRVAVSIGDDTDTVAAIAGALLGAVHGVTSIPFLWRHGLAGWPSGYRGIDLTRLAVRAANRGQNDADEWPQVSSMADSYKRFTLTGMTARFDVDPDVVFGDYAALRSVEADAFLSLCRIGVDDQRCVDHELVWLLDAEGNADAGRVLANTADAIQQLRREGRRVFVHCVRAESRTPTVAMAWLMRHHGREFADAYAEVLAAMPTASPCESLLAGVRSLGCGGR
jgi:ADP-ribosylglycohydrolase